jgi:HAD superfamily hydrolase (TIGR01549 family)
MRAVVFDLDNTLYPRTRFVRSGLAAVAHYAEAHLGVPTMRAFTTMLKAFETQPGTEFQALCETFGLRSAIVPELLQVFRTHRPELWFAHAGLETLKQLRADGWRIGILTNGLPHVQASKVQALGLRSLVDHIVYAAEYAEGGKPHQAPFAEIIRRAGVPADRCVMVGDDVECDIRGAREAGMRTIWIKRDGVEGDAGANLVLESLDQVPAAAASLVEIARPHAA